jgi:putative flippase GtrA
MAYHGRALVAALARARTGRGAVHIAFTFGLHVATGFIAVAAHYGSMWLFLRGGLGPVAASASGFVAGALARFALSYFGVFVPSKGMAVAGWRFVLAILLQLALNSALLSLLLAAGLGVWYAQVIATIALTFLNFVVYRLWVFR